MKKILALSLIIYTALSEVKCPNKPAKYPSNKKYDCNITSTELSTGTTINTNNMPELNVVITSETKDITRVICNNNYCKDVLRVYAGGLDNFELDCKTQDSCKNAKVRVGDVDIAPVGYNIVQFTGNRSTRASVDIDCGGKSSCAGATIYVKGNYPGGVEVLALSIDSFDKGTLVCDLEKGQSCKLICGPTTSCDGSELVCMGGRCQCIGNSCPLVVRPPGSDPDTATTLGESPNVKGLNCIAGTDDNPPDECRFDKIKKGNLQGAVICSENYDCCLCEKIYCQECTSIVCNGDQGCIGVPMEVYGHEKLGARISCGGDLSCEFSKIKAENLVSIGANGDLSLLGSDLYLNLNTKNDGGLPALSIPCDGDGSCMLSKITANNVINLLCGGDYSCEKTIVKLLCKKLGTDKGCVLSCGGDNSCSDSIWNVDGIVAFVANGDHSAARNKFVFNFVEAGAPHTCGGDNSCQEGNFNLTNVNRLECTGDESCERSLFNVECIKGKGCVVIINGNHGAKKAIWNINNAASLTCQGGSSCREGNYNINCAQGAVGCPITCGGHESCRMLNLDITNVGELTCNGIGACKKANFNINCLSNGDDKGCPISCVSTMSCYESHLKATNVGGMACLGNGSCKMANINISCTKGSKGCPLRCGGVRSCPNSNIIGSNIGEITFQGREVAIGSQINAECVNEKGCRVTCSGVKPCSNTTLIVNNAFSLSCIGNSACEYSNIELNCVNNDNGCPLVCASGNACSNGNFKVVNSGGLSCVKDSCSNSNFKILNNKGGALSCVGSSSCENSVFDAFDNVMSVDCSGRSACKGSRILGSCNPNSGCSLVCTGFETCRSSTIQLRDVKEMKCDNTNACSDTRLEIYTNQGNFKGNCGMESCINSKITIKSRNDIEYISGWECTSSFGCANTEIIFDGTELFTKQLMIRELKCGAPYSCMNTKFIFKNAKININVLRNACQGIHSCDNNEITIICQDYNGRLLEDAACITEEFY